MMRQRMLQNQRCCALPRGAVPGAASRRAARRTRSDAPGAAAAAAAEAATGAATWVDTSLAGWICGSGGHVAGAQLVYTRDEAGGVDRQLVASKDLAPGERIMLVPRPCQVRDTGCADPRLSALMDAAPKAAGSTSAAWQFRMALQLVAYRLAGPGGTHHSYIKQLPGVAAGVPSPRVAMTLADSALAELQNPALAADAAGQVHFCREFAAGPLAALPAAGAGADPFGGEAVTEELLEWGLALAMSRSFGFKRSPGHGMVPLVDMANHSFDSNAEIRADDSGDVSMIANKQIPAGAPLLLRYGTHSNADLLLSYGFVADPNPYNAYTFPFDADFVLGAVQQFVGASAPTPRPSDGLKTWQRTMLAEMGLLSPQQQQQQQQQQQEQPQRRKSAGFGKQQARRQQQAEQQQQQQQQEEEEEQPEEGRQEEGQQQEQQRVVVSIGGDHPVQGPLLAAVRVMLSEDRKAVKARTAEELGDWSKPLSTAHEALVMKALVGLCTVLYKSFPTSIQQDAKLLMSPPAAGPAGAPTTPSSGSSSSSGGSSSPGGGSGGAWSEDPEGARLAVQYRLAAKRGLEASTKKLLLRMKELLA